jgi:hypothetical protein
MSKLIDKYKKGTYFYYSDGATYEVWAKVIEKLSFDRMKVFNIVFYKEMLPGSSIDLETKIYADTNLEMLTKRADLRIVKDFSQRVIRKIFEFK